MIIVYEQYVESFTFKNSANASIQRPEQRATRRPFTALPPPAVSTHWSAFYAAAVSSTTMQLISHRAAATSEQGEKISLIHVANRARGDKIEEAADSTLVQRPHGSLESLLHPRADRLEVRVHLAWTLAAARITSRKWSRNPIRSQEVAEQGRNRH